MLRALARVFDGFPEELNRAVGIMSSLHLSALQLVRTPSGLPEGGNAGPSFSLPGSD
jgi:hypothetical protein